MSPRPKSLSKYAGPGPSHYNISGHQPGDRSPAYSLGIKHYEYAPPMIVECDN